MHVVKLIICVNFSFDIGSAQYKTPVFKLKNRVTGKFLTAPASVDSDITHEDAGSNQDWYVYIPTVIITLEGSDHFF